MFESMNVQEIIAIIAAGYAGGKAVYEAVKALLNKLRGR